MSDATLNIDMSQFDIAAARISNPAQFRALVQGVGLIIETAFKVYPGRSSPTRASVYGTAFKSLKQRRWFFWALAHGAIQVPYRRGQSPGSKNLQQSWTTKMLSDTSVQVGTQVPYGPLLMSAGSQSKYAEAQGWRTIETRLVDVTPKVKAGLETGIAKILQV
jgi:hypothetical protein